MSGEGHLRVAGSKPRLLVAVVEFGVAGNIAGDDFGGRQSRVKTNPRLQGTGEAVLGLVGELLLPAVDGGLVATAADDGVAATTSTSRLRAAAA